LSKEKKEEKEKRQELEGGGVKAAGDGEGVSVGSSVTDTEGADDFLSVIRRVREMSIRVPDEAVWGSEVKVVDD
jgi:hypothetical protein